MHLYCISLEIIIELIAKEIFLEFPIPPLQSGPPYRREQWHCFLFLHFPPICEHQLCPHRARRENHDRFKKISNGIFITNTAVMTEKMLRTMTMIIFTFSTIQTSQITFTYKEYSQKWYIFLLSLSPTILFHSRSTYHDSFLEQII